METILEVKGLSKNFPGFSLQNISFSLDRGYIMGFIGPNGAGKTTTIKLIMNLLRRQSGEIRVFGLDNLRDEQDIKKRIGFVYDENYYYEELTALEIKRVIAPFYPTWNETAFTRYLKLFALPGDKKVKNLSKGMKLKLALALALSHEPELLIMDEPTSGLDPVFRSELLDILRDYLTDEKKGILFSTRITSDLDKIADYVTFINEGKIVLSESKDILLERYGVVKGEKSLLDEGLRKCLLGVRETPYGFEGLTGDKEGVCRKWKDALLVERPALEDIMLYTVRGNKSV